jgi:hypothetical protein
MKGLFMALEWLKTILGDTYTDEIDKKVSDQIGKSFVSKEDFNKANESKKTLETQVSEKDKLLGERDAQLEALKKVDAAGLQAEITKLQEANQTTKTEYEAKLKETQLEYKLENLLIKEGAVNVKAVKALLDASKISLDGENLLGVDEQLKSIKESEKWAFGASTQTNSGKEHDGAGGGEKTVNDELREMMFPTK